MTTEPYLLTPGPLTTSLRTRQAMLHDWGSWDVDFNTITGRIRERLLQIVSGGGTHECVPLQGSGTHSCVPSVDTICNKRSRIRPVMVLKSTSQEPQSCSIACRVRSEVVKGPGVRRYGSVVI